MKYALFILMFLSVLLFGCTSVKTTSSGVDNESYLEFLGDPDEFSGGIEVDIDGELTFIAEVEDTVTVKRLDGKVYTVSPGIHVITITYKGDVIYKQKVMLSNQETRKVKL